MYSIAIFVFGVGISCLLDVIWLWLSLHFQDQETFLNNIFLFNSGYTEDRFHYITATTFQVYIHTLVAYNQI